jgi:PAS domain S-box-containing protein
MAFGIPEAKVFTRTKWQKVAADPRGAPGYLGGVAQTLTFPNAPEVDIDGLMEKAFIQADYAVNITDTRGVLLRVNQAYLDLYKFRSEAEILGKTQRLIRSPRTHDGLYRDMWDTISTGRTWRGNLTNVAQDGSEVYVHLTISPLREKGRIIGYMGFSLDRAQQVLLERELFHANKLMVLGTLGAGLAHELNNPLASILLDAEYLRDALTDPARPIAREEAAGAARSVIAGVERMKKVLEHLLLYSRKESAQRFSTIAVDQLLEESFLFMEKQLRNRGIDIRLEAEKDLYVSCNRTQLESVIHNLLANSRDAFEGRLKAGRRISISARIENASLAHIEYRDNAGGIPEHLLPRIFEPFFTTKSEKDGTGLGLAISRKIVLEHGGSLDCESRGETTAFHIRLPLTLAQALEP